MEVKKMSLGSSPTPSSSGSSIMDYALGDECLAKVKEVINESPNLEFWHPKYQAWRQLLERYLSSGNDHQLTRSVLPALLEKIDWIKVPECTCTPLFNDVLRLQTTGGSEVFRDVRYNTIVEFCDVQCQFLISQRKRILKEIHTEGVSMDVMNQLLAKGTYRALMCAVILFRENERIGFEYPDSVRDAIAARVNAWREEFLREFRVIQELLGPLNEMYVWYCDTVYRVLDRTWSTALMRVDRPVLITAEDTFSVSKDLAGLLQGYVLASPAGFGLSLEKTSVFDAFYQIFYNNIAGDPDNAERAFFALCIPKNLFNNMVDALYSFYWCVADQQLSDAMYASVKIAYVNNSKFSTTPEEYLESLRYRGFPDVHRKE